MIILETKRCSIGQKLCRIQFRLIVLVLCKNRLLTHCAIVSLQIIFFKISQQIAKHILFDH